ncbi:MAG: hypothetical protein R6V85_21675 [Polyangia bacterium]
MRNEILFAMAAVALLVTPLAAGCSDDGPPALEPDGGEDGGDGDYDQHIVEGGGFTGGPIEGLLVMWFFDEPSGDPLADVHVMAGNDPASALIGTTDADGRVVFEDDSLEGPVDVHSFKEGYSAGSLYGLDATYATIEREPSGHEDPEPQTVTFSGSVSGFDVVPSPTSTDQVKVAFVNFGLPIEDLLSGDYEEIEQEEVDEMPVNMVVPALGSTDFELVAHRRTGTLFVTAGILDTSVLDLQLSHAAMIERIDPESDQTEGLELELDVELSEILEIAVDPLSDGYARVAAHVAFDLGENGSVGFGSIGGPVGDPIQIALPSGPPFDEAGNLVVIHAGQDEEAAVSELDEYPSGSRLFWDADLSSWMPSHTVSDLLQPPAGLSWNGSALEADVPADASFFSLEAQDAEGDTSWGALVMTSPMAPVALPNLPQEWGWAGLPSGEIRFEVSAVRIEGEVNDIAFDDLSERIESSSENLLIVE